MEKDAVLCHPQRTDLREHFYKFIMDISPHLHVSLLAKYMQDSLNGHNSTKLMEKMTNIDYMKHLYKLGLIHPRNIDYILNFANYTRNENLQHHIVLYYSVVDVRDDLLIDVNTKFMLTNDNPGSRQSYSLPPRDETRGYSSQTQPSHLPNTQLIYGNEPQPTIATRSVYNDNQRPQIEQVHEVFHSQEETTQPFIYPVVFNRPHGFCVVINNEVFTSTSGYVLNSRIGTSKDGEQLVDAFKFLNYNTDLFENLSSREIMDCLNSYAKADHTTFDSFVCCILTHGNAGSIFGSDSVEIKLNQIFDLFQVNSAHTLSGKPKIFVIQACRGTYIDQGSKNLVNAAGKYLDELEVEEISQNEKPESPILSNKHLPLFCDFLIAYSTVQGYVAWRHPDWGSWFIDILCNKLKQHFDKNHIVDILTFVNFDMSQKKTGDGSKQMAAPVNSMKGLFYFKPPESIQANYI
ncbi:Caspase-2 [Oopsacas minuta]|uniref:Caspase-2 n=1 Tax=Oopsacas minuta TaxID=111878 RepID=A0AAV7K0K3_9METZ|nr:Caspase-2 [Oopsacas minuta]